MVHYTYKTQFGNIAVVSDGSAVTAINFKHEFDCIKKANTVTDTAANQLEEYFAGKRQIFEIPLNPIGTVFQKRVWNTLLTIPYGETRTYKQIAALLGNPNACRAVGMANSKNPIWIMLPCHRVIGANGTLTGYAGGIEFKKKLLELERFAVKAQFQH